MSSRRHSGECCEDPPCFPCLPLPHAWPLVRWLMGFCLPALVSSRNVLWKLASVFVFRSLKARWCTLSGHNQELLGTVEPVARRSRPTRRDEEASLPSHLSRVVSRRLIAPFELAWSASARHHLYGRRRFRLNVCARSREFFRGWRPDAIRGDPDYWPLARRNAEDFSIASGLNTTETVPLPVTGAPFIVAGLNRHCFTANSADPRNTVAPSTALAEITLPVVSTTIAT